jgi:hypothetical protein
MKFSEFLDRLLFKLYEFDREHSDEFANLSELAETIKGDVPPSWIVDAGKVLDARALADVIFTFGGTDAKISGEGRLYVEEGRGTTPQIQQAPQNYYINIPGHSNQVVVGNSGQVLQRNTIEQERAPAFKLLDEIERKLSDDPNTKGANETEAKTYVGLIRQELRKAEPNKNVIAAVLDPLTKIASIAGSVASLIKLFNSSP